MRQGKANMFSLIFAAAASMASAATSFKPRFDADFTPPSRFNYGPGTRSGNKPPKARRRNNSVVKQFRGCYRPAT
jgi:hypothetical protein